MNTIDFLIFYLGSNSATAGYKAPDMGYIQFFFSRGYFIVVWDASGNCDQMFKAPNFYFRYGKLSSKELYKLVSDHSLPLDAALW